MDAALREKRKKIEYLETISSLSWSLALFFPCSIEKRSYSLADAVASKLH